MTATAIREDASTGDAKSAKQGKDAKKGSFLTSKIGIVVIVIVLAGAFIGYKMAFPAKAAPPSGGEVVKLDPTTLNLTGGHYLKVAVNVQLVKGKATAAAFEISKAAELVLDEFSNRSVASLSSYPARKKLQDELFARMKLAYPGEVWEVFLIQFVTQ